jgi:RNA polymerase sigma-70 factor (subfamily 1)
MAEPEEQPIEQTIDLVHRAHAGDREALNELFARYYERVRRIVRLRLGPALRARMGSDDILQEVFLEALRGFDRFEMRDEGSLINYLACIAEHRIRDAADFNRAAKRDAAREVPIAPPDASGQLDRDLSAAGLPPAEGASLAEQVARLEAAIEKLAPADRELILLHDYARATWPVIAQQTGRASPDAARMAHKEAVRRLGMLLGQA